MQTKFKFLMATIMGLFLFFTGCKKNDVSKEEFSNEITEHSNDQSQVSQEIDATTNDITAAVESSAFFSGRVSGTLSICGATTAFDTLSNQKKITITYDGLNCFGSHSRKGVVVLSIPAGTRWKDAGAVLTVSIQNLKITRVRDNKSITLNGTKNITNVSGGLLYQLASLATITHTINSSNMTITFDNNAQRVWQVAKKRVFSYQNGVVITTTGTHTAGSNSQIAEWGTNRFGQAFTSSITQPLIIRQDCDFRVTGGEIKYESVASSTATFGLDANGNPTSCPGSGHYYLKVTWTGPGGNVHNHIQRY